LFFDFWGRIRSTGIFEVELHAEVSVNLFKKQKKTNANTIVGKVLRGVCAAFASERGAAPMLAAA